MKTSLPAYLFLAGAAALALSVPVSAQTGGQPVVQPIPGGEGIRLNAALGRLARNPRDVDALIEAGMASLSAGDGDAAIGFYQKADTLSPGNLRIKGGLAGAYVLAGDPVSALPIFDQAEALGLLDAARVADRGLAYDLVGDPVTAQRYYREALMAGPSDETSRRLALSQAIAGDRRGMEVTLAPLLQRQDKAAWRTRAFALAILGQVDEADSITRSTMPPELAGAIGGYLRYMPKLTPAQQAGAANLGRFPRAAEIGRDDPRLAQFVRTKPVLAALTPQRQPLVAAGRAAKRDDKRDRKPPKDSQPVRTATLASASPPPVMPASVKPVPAVQPAPVVAAPARPAPEPARSLPAPAMPAPPPAQNVPVSVPVAGPAASPPSVPAETRPQPGFAALDPAPAGFDLKPSASPAPPAAAVPPAPAKQPAAAPRPRSLAEVFADLTPPSREAEPQAGAVDLRKIKTPQPKAADAKGAASDPKAAGRDKACEVPDSKVARAAKGKAAVKAPPLLCKDDKAKTPANPSRFWVQLATGKDRKGLSFDWRKLAKDDPALFKGRKAYVSAIGQSTRLLTGPFDTAAQAGAFVAQLKKAGVGGAFAWTSPAGQAVDALPGG